MRPISLETSHLYLPGQGKTVNAIRSLVFVMVVCLLTLASCAYSTPGVKVVDYNVIDLPSGETAIFRGMVGRILVKWTVTFDGDETVSIECTPYCRDRTATVPNIGDQANVTTLGLYDDFVVTRTSSNTVDVEWPSGINLE